MRLNAPSCHPLLLSVPASGLSIASAETIHLNNGRIIVADRVQLANEGDLARKILKEGKVDTLALAKVPCGTG